MAGVVIGAVAGAFVLSALVSYTYSGILIFFTNCSIINLIDGVIDGVFNLLISLL